MIEWLKARWRWLTIGALIVVSAIVGFFLRKPAPVVGPELKEAEDEEKKRLAEAEQKKRELDAEKQKEVERLKKEHEAAIAKMTTEETKRLEELQNSPEELNAWLIEVGQKTRQ